MAQENRKVTGGAQGVNWQAAARDYPVRARAVIYMGVILVVLAGVVVYGVLTRTLGSPEADTTSSAVAGAQGLSLADIDPDLLARVRPMPAAPSPGAVVQGRVTLASASLAGTILTLVFIMPDGGNAIVLVDMTTGDKTTLTLP